MKDLENSSFKTIQGRVTGKCSGTPSGMCPDLGRLGHGRDLWEQNCQHSWEPPSPFALVATEKEGDCHFKDLTTKVVREVLELV